MTSQPHGRRPLSILALLLARLEAAALALSAVVIAVMALHVMADVGSRFVFGRPLDGSTEIVSRYYMVAVIFLPLAFLHAENGHVAAGLVSDMLPARWRRLTEASSHLLMAVFGAILGWRCAIEAMRATQNGEQLQTAIYFLPTWPARWIIPIAVALLVLRALVMAWRDLAAFAHPAGDAPREPA